MIKKIWIMILITLIGLPMSIFSQEKGFTVEGVISFKKEGDIYILIFNEAASEEKEGGTISKSIKIELSSEEIKAKKVFFKFEDVPEGFYAIRLFQDTNGNGKLDKGAFGIPKESWASYKAGGMPPSFKKMRFEVSRDIKNIKMKLK